MADLAPRAAKPTDAAGIRELLETAFDGPAEADLVDSLSADGDMAIELVVDDGGTIAGHIAFSRLVSPVGGLVLAPLAVAAAYRRRGIGAALVEHGLARARADGWSSVFVLGDPGYYGRFGFRAEAAAPFASPYAGPYLMALALTTSGLAGGMAGGLESVERSLIHAGAFAGL